MLTGSCLCGHIAFAIDGPLEKVGHCHCSMCRKAHGSAFATVAAVSTDHYRWTRREGRVMAYQTVLRARLSGFRWLAGIDNIAEYHLPGTRFQCAFCRTCGSRVPWERDDQVCVPAGSLDADPGDRPNDNIHTDSRAAWSVVPTG